MQTALVLIAIYLAAVADAALAPRFTLAGAAPQWTLVAGLAACHCARWRGTAAAGLGLVCDWLTLSSLGSGMCGLFASAELMQLLDVRFRLSPRAQRRIGLGLGLVLVLGVRWGWMFAWGDCGPLGPSLVWPALASVAASSVWLIPLDLGCEVAGAEVWCARRPANFLGR